MKLIFTIFYHISFSAVEVRQSEIQLNYRETARCHTWVKAFALPVVSQSTV